MNCKQWQAAQWQSPLSALSPRQWRNCWLAVVVVVVVIVVVSWRQINWKTVSVWNEWAVKGDRCSVERRASERASVPTSTVSPGHTDGLSSIGDFNGSVCWHFWILMTNWSVETLQNQYWSLLLISSSPGSPGDKCLNWSNTAAALMTAASCTHKNCLIVWLEQGGECYLLLQIRKDDGGEKTQRTK